MRSDSPDNLISPKLPIIVIFFVSAIPEFKSISLLRLSKLSPVEKKSEKSQYCLFGIDDMLNKPNT